MAIKLKDFLREVAEKGGIRDTDFEAALGASALAEVEISDEFKTKFNASYLTVERAKNDPTIVTEIRKAKSKEIWDNVDQKIDALLDFVDDETKTTIKEKTFETYKKLDLLKEGIAAGIKAREGKKQTVDVQKIEEEWNGKLKKATEERQAEVAQLKKQHKENSLTTALKLKINEYQFGEHFRAIKDVLSNSIIDKLRQEQYNGNPIVLDLSEDGTQLRVLQNVDGSTREIFDNNQNKVTIESLLQKHVDPFVVKSNGNGGTNGKTDASKGGDGQKKIVTLPPNPTLHQIMAAQAQ